MLAIVIMKKAKTVKTKIIKLIKVFDGNIYKLADELGCHWDYINKLKRGFVPGKHMYKFICDYYNETMAKKGEQDGSRLEDGVADRTELNKISETR